MENVTWQQLIDYLELHDIDLQDNISIYVKFDNEFLPVENLSVINYNEDVLPFGSAVLTINY